MTEKKETLTEMMGRVVGRKPKKKEIVREIEGALVFQRTGQGMATFKLVCENIFSNPLVQIPLDVLPTDYTIGKYEVTGTFVYRIVAKEK